MNLRKLLTCAPLLALTIIPPAADANDGHGKKQRYKAKGYYADPYAWPRATREHRPYDNNGDGVVSRREWPGNPGSFRQLDRNRDGILSDADRRLRRRDSRVYNWRERDRIYRYR